MQKSTAYVSESQDVNAAMQRNGHLTKAPKGTYGCEHCAMVEMRKISVEYFNHYISKADRPFYNEKCSGKKCKHGKAGKHWPIKKVCGDQWQAYWCKFACSGECKTYFCMDCGQERLDMENSKDVNKGRKTHRRNH